MKNAFDYLFLDLEPNLAVLKELRHVFMQIYQLNQVFDPRLWRSGASDSCEEVGSMFSFKFQQGQKGLVGVVTSRILHSAYLFSTLETKFWVMDGKTAGKKCEESSYLSRNCKPDSPSVQCIFRVQR